MKITNKLNLPQPIVDAVTRDDYDRGNAEYTVTELLSPPKANRIIKDHWDEIEEDVADSIYALMGKAIHAILEKADKVAMKEDRYYVKIDGIAISGKFDRVAVGNEQWWGKYLKYSKMLTRNVPLTMQDYKVASVWEFIYGVKPDKVAQLNILAYIARKHKFMIDRLQLIYIYRDWSKSKARFDSKYPQKQVSVVDVPVWSDEECELYIRERVAVHEEAKKTLPDCTLEEIWAKPEKFAVMKEGRKTAIKLHDKREEAERHLASEEIKGGYIEHRKNPPARCRDYCSAFMFCDQGKSYYEDGDSSEEQ